MKKLKEALIFIISILVLMVVPILMFVLAQSKDQVIFISNWNYLKLLFQDELFFKGVINTYVPMLCVSFAVALVLFFVRKYILKTRKIFFPVCIASSSAAAFICNVILFIKAYPPPYMFTVYEVIMALQVGLIATFLVWIIELVIQKTRR